MSTQDLRLRASIGQPLTGADTQVPLRKPTLAAKSRNPEGCIGQAAIESENADRVVAEAAAKLGYLVAIRNREVWISVFFALTPTIGNRARVRC